MDSRYLLVATFILFSCNSTDPSVLYVCPDGPAERMLVKWEQRCVHWKDVVEYNGVNSLNSELGWNPVLESYGEEGWEAFAVSFSYDRRYMKTVCFKRPFLKH